MKHYNINAAIQTLAKKSIPKILKCLIYSDTENSYVLFDEYKIVQHDTECTIYRYRDERAFEFNAIRNATAWAILDKYNKLWEANRVLELDKKIESIRVDSVIHSKKKTRASLDNEIIRLNKLQHDKDRECRFIHELNKYIIMANNCQQRGFENELRRTEKH